MPDFTPLRGHDAIDKAQTRSSKFSPFAPQLTWRKAAEEKYLLIISPIEKVYTADLHEFIEVGKGEKANGETYQKYESFVSRKSLGANTDKIEDELGRTPRRRSLGVGVELDPVYETVRGRKRPKGFVVKTETFTRTTDDGEVEVEAPVIGMVIQAQKNFYGYLNSYDRTQGPVHETPFQVIRRGVDQDTTYDFIPFVGVDVDFSPLFDNVDNIAYLRDTDIPSQPDGAEDDWTAAADIGTAFLEKRWNELASDERYHEFMDSIDTLPPSRFGSSNKPTASRGSRPARKSPRENGDSGDSSTTDSDRMEAFEKLKAEVGAK